MSQNNASLITGLTFVATLGGLLFGYDTAVISVAVSSIDANFIDPLHLSETVRGSLSGWTVSSALFGCVIGAVIAGWVSNAIGRKGGMLVAAAVELQDGTPVSLQGTGTATTAAATSIVEDELGQASNTTLIQIPDFAMRFQMDQPWGHIGVNGIIHQTNLRNIGGGTGEGANTANGFKKQAESEAIAVTGHLNTFGKDRLAGGVEWDKGVAGVMSAMSSDAVMNANSGAWNQLTMWAVYANYEHFFNGNWRSVASFGYAKALNNIGVTEGYGATNNLGAADNAAIARSFFSTHLNIIYSPVPMLDVTTEWVHYLQTQRSSANATTNRIEESVKRSEKGGK